MSKQPAGAPRTGEHGCMMSWADGVGAVSGMSEVSWLSMEEGAIR